MPPPIPEPGPLVAPTLEIAHVLFMDIVAYSKLPMHQQQRLLADLQEAIRNIEEFARAQNLDKLICLPTGDGMVLVFFGNPESPVRCAIELSRALRQHPEIKLRMGSIPARSIVLRISTQIATWQAVASICPRG